MGRVVGRRSKPKPTASTPPRYAARTATLEVTFGLKVAGVAPLPADFEPAMNRPPLWLLGGHEVGVIGNRAGKGVILGFSGPNLSRKKVIIEDEGTGAPEGRLFDAALSPDNHTLAAAVAALGKQLDVNLIDVSNPSETLRIASLKGEFSSAQLAWLSSTQIVLAVQSEAPTGGDSLAATNAVPVRGLYLITAGQPTSIRHLDGIKCPLSRLAVSPNGAFAVAQGTNSAPPEIVDLHGERCVRFPHGGQIQVIGWAPNAIALLYRTADRKGVFGFDRQTGQRATIAISSGAAAYASDGTIIALGSDQLSRQRAVAEPMSPVTAQIALFDPHQSLITINSLGFATRPDLLAQSTMVFSQVSNDAVIDIAVPVTMGLRRLIIEYSYPTRAAFVLAHGAVTGPIAISWSPDGKQIAIVDGDATHHTLSVITPPK